ncbi:Na+/H+ antiporter NhaC [Aneurinibacillus thermoaerophilus]|uniref:Na+/H+ antiporter NhaC n=1 Tax=Aneurinibacillus thermoaerophilus TaxID=143495 RepID=A0A1G7WS08_ANETH|nr:MULTISPECIES: Na+/H+ antiporter NhaC [Aneurinibacillus]AMA73992.1 sodium:proton antiporter [Aneurinibacillus sp. XH2]MED0676247.1 Na+/H+ antiporter NhaC [Aneurinibacillus thermoaerophilus]MED0678179.1 Na+/H+ antiporter NhaC [Aneurinibacillus thermoaerophilus]MED0755627.1 Na+/H+ antiporter NhaC [Aneurinibacillus thermoaerophilus]MED0760044.1 Na+/H+ antiporter NhaC [Aneurinibacillus thermoaerophilus]
MPEQHQETKFTKAEAGLITLFLLSILSFCIIGWQAPPHVPLLLSLFLLIIISSIKKVPWKTVEEGMIEGVRPGLTPIFIFILIGALISVWIASGTVPTMMAYGFSILSGKYFLAAVLLITAVVGTCTGSSLTTTATIGVAFMGMGTMIGINPAWIAGAIVSGAFFGDKMSPLSDTTNLAPTVARIDLFTHIRHMTWTTTPALLLSLLLFLFLGNGNAGAIPQEQIEGLHRALIEHAVVHPVALLPPLLIMVMAMRRISAIPTLMVGILSGIAVAFMLNHELKIGDMIGIIQNGFTSETGNKVIDSLLTRGGIQSMMFSVSLIFLSLSMGGLLYHLGIIYQLMDMIQRFIQTRGRLIASTALSAIGINLLLGEQYLSIILTGNAFVKQYKKLGLARKNLARTLEDAGTVVNPLIPWGVSGVFISGVLGVSVFEYAPFAFFCLLCPVITILFGFTGIGVPYETKKRS